MPGLVEFATYFGMGLGFMVLYVVLYLYATPHREITLIRGDNLPAAVVLAGALLGFAGPLALPRACISRRSSPGSMAMTLSSRVGP